MRTIVTRWGFCGVLVIATAGLLSLPATAPAQLPRSDLPGVTADEPDAPSDTDEDADAETTDEKPTAKKRAKNKQQQDEQNAEDESSDDIYEILTSEVEEEPIEDIPLPDYEVPDQELTDDGELPGTDENAADEE